MLLILFITSNIKQLSSFLRAHPYVSIQLLHFNDRDLQWCVLTRVGSCVYVYM